MMWSRTKLSRNGLVLAGLIVFAPSSRVAFAQDDVYAEPRQDSPPASESGPPTDDGLTTESSKKADARASFQRGVEHVRAAQWSEALAQFEASAAAFDNPVTTFNIGACERALGRYTKARISFALALEKGAQNPGAMPKATEQEARAFLQQIDAILARATIEMVPSDLAIAVDGRPLTVPSSTGQPYTAGIEAPGPGIIPKTAKFEVIVDPGAHVFTFSKKGHTDAVVNRTFAPGQTLAIAANLERLPATLKITSSEPGAIVRVENADVGPAPVDVLRPAGTYEVTVGKSGFIDYQTQVTVRPGEELDLRAPLAIDEPSVLESFWFWAGAAAVVAGGAVVTWAVTRPEPEPPPYDGGSSDWVVQPARF